MNLQIAPRDRKVVMWGTTFAVLLVLYLAVLDPLTRQWDALGSRLNRAQRKITDVQTEITDAIEARTTLAELKLRAHTYPAVTSLNQQTARMLNQIESLSSYREINVSRLEGMPLRQEDNFYRSGVSLQFGGSLNSLYHFLEEVETARPRLRVERMSVAQDQKTAGRVEGQMVISGYAVVLGGKRDS